MYVLLLKVQYTDIFKLGTKRYRNKHNLNSNMVMCRLKGKANP